MPNYTKNTMPNPEMQEGMTEATRLTNAGKLSEATAAIQRALGSPLGNPLGNPLGGPLGDYMPAQGGVRVEDPPASSGPKGPKARPDADSMVSRLLDLPDSLTRDIFRREASMEGVPEGVIPHAPEPGAPGVGPQTAGRFVSGSYTNRSGTRGYKLYIPGGTNGEPLPLLVMLHGCTQNPDDFAAGTRMNTLAESGNFFVVYPEQTSSSNMNKCWNWFNAGDQHRDQGEPSIIAGITHQIAATQPVDTKRIYVAGMSAGAAMAVILGETYPDLYAAVGVHSGLAYGAAHDLPSAFGAMQGGAGASGASARPEAVDLARTVPAIVFHGDRDSTVNRRNAEQVLNQKLSGLRGPATPQATPRTTPRATVRQGQVRGGRSYTHSVYRTADEDPVAELWIVHGAGHAWSGGSPQGSYTDANGPDASIEMVRFFLDHPRG
ncbi:MAG: PHB depolymerase family esterase [Rubrobacteraceae bacterium]